MAHRTSEPLLDIPEGFGPIRCRNHPDREVVDPQADRFCSECHMNAWNAGARRADAEWHKQPHERPEWRDDGKWIYGGNANRE